jgi:hypothetical protein
MRRRLMNRRLVALLAGGCAVALMAAATATAAGPKQNIVSGTGLYDYPGVADRAHDHMNGKSDPDTTTHARGRYRLEETLPGLEGTWLGRVTCLRVVGNRAIAQGVVVQSTSLVQPVGSGFRYYVEDNGSPGGLDRTEVFRLLAPSTICPPPPAPPPAFQLTAGNYVVKAAKQARQARGNGLIGARAPRAFGGNHLDCRFECARGALDAG